MFIETVEFEFINVRCINTIKEETDTTIISNVEYDQTCFVAHLDTGKKVVLHRVLTPKKHDYPYHKHNMELTGYSTLLSEALKKHNLIINILS